MTKTFGNNEVIKSRNVVDVEFILFETDTYIAHDMKNWKSVNFKTDETKRPIDLVQRLHFGRGTKGIYG